MEHTTNPLPRLIERSDDLWVFDKATGFAVHPTSDPNIPDLLTWAVEHAGAPASLSPIHRLDRETSGLVLCSPNREVIAQISAWLADSLLTKEYRALVHGHTHKSGTIKRPLKDRRGRKQRAVTRYRRLAQYGGATYLEALPASGRRHQIRRHLQGIGHAIVGDRRYRPRRPGRVTDPPRRLWLHAYRLDLPDGRSFVAELPPELQAHLDLLSSRQTG